MIEHGALLDELDLGVLLVDRRLDAIQVANRAARNVLEMLGAPFGGNPRTIPPIVRRAALASLAQQPPPAATSSFGQSVKIAARSGTPVYVRAKRLSPGVSRVLVTLSIGVLRERDLLDLAQARFKLPFREARLVPLLRAGLDNRTIAIELGLTIATIKKYVSNILDAFEVHNRAELIVAIERLRPNGDS